MNRPILWRLTRLNRTAVFLITLAVGLLGLFLPGVWGALVLICVVGGLVALLGQTWSATPPVLRVARVLIISGLVVIAFLKILS